MSEHQLPNTPFKTLGTHLKYLREQSQESLAEVSGAVEIDEKTLSRIEEGRERPDEDILLLMINHFGMPDQEAVQLWELAGYDGAPGLLRNIDPTNADDAQKAVVMLLAFDTRSIYTDGVDILCNQAGVTLNFTQASNKDQANTVSRLGMSYEQAEHLSHALQLALLKAKYLKGPKGLPPNSSVDNT